MFKFFKNKKSKFKRKSYFEITSIDDIERMVERYPGNPKKMMKFINDFKKSCVENLYYQNKISAVYEEVSFEKIESFSLCKGCSKTEFAYCCIFRDGSAGKFLVTGRTWPSGWVNYTSLSATHYERIKDDSKEKEKFLDSGTYFEF